MTMRSILSRTSATLVVLLSLGFAPTADAAKDKPPKQKQLQASRDRGERVISVLREEVARMDAQIDELENKMEELFSQKRADGKSLIEPETLRNLERDRIRAEGDFVQVERLYRSLKEKSRAELRQAIPTAYRDEALDRYLDKLSATEQNLTILRKDYSAEHPDVVRMTAVYSNINAQIETRIDGVMSGLETLVSARRAVFQKLNERITEESKTGGNEKTQERAQHRLKRDIEIMERIRDSLKERLIREEVELRLLPRDMSK